jgi:hypothetical protein
VTAFQLIAGLCGSFDYDCDDAEERESVAVSRCDGFVSCGIDYGWMGESLPRCGEREKWMDACGPYILAPFPCVIWNSHWAFQRCR